jgi:hypothetical protein
MIEHQTWCVTDKRTIIEVEIDSSNYADGATMNVVFIA